MRRWNCCAGPKQQGCEGAQACTHAHTYIEKKIAVDFKIKATHTSQTGTAKGPDAAQVCSGQKSSGLDFKYVALRLTI